MSTVTTRPNPAIHIPDLTSGGILLLNSLTAEDIWAEGRLQYYLGNSSSLSLDSQFEDLYDEIWGKGTLPDATFQFEALTVRAFESIDAVTALEFSRTFKTAKADFVLVSASKPDDTLEGFFEFPGIMYHDENPSTDSWSFGALNSGFGYMMAAAERGGGEYANWTVIHEIGHSLGLTHTHQERGNLPPLRTVGKHMDNEMYSVMSYNGVTIVADYGHAVSMMALDVAALQALYGAEDYATGNSTYTLYNAQGGDLSLVEGNVAIGRAYYSIWDSGGTDTIRYGNDSQSVLINLNDATLDTGSVSADLKAMFAQLKISSFYQALSTSLQQEIVGRWHHAGGFFSHVLNGSDAGYTAIEGGFSIAHNAVIENAVGGVMADLLIGNEHDNVLQGAAGRDTLLGANGNDTLRGGRGRDRLDGGFGSDMLYGGAGADRFVFAQHYGKDTIADFGSGDVIDVTRLRGADSYSVVVNHMRNVDGNVVIAFGSDVLVILDHSISDFSRADFAI